MHDTRTEEREGGSAVLAERENVFGTMSKGAYNVEGGVAGDRRTIRRATRVSRNVVEREIISNMRVRRCPISHEYDVLNRAR